MRKACLLSLLAIIPAFGQLESNTLTISATRSTYLQPDEVVFSLSVTSPVSTSLDQVVAALSSLGITAANLSGVGSNATPPTQQWNFTLAVPISSLTATIGSITKLEQTFAQNNNGLTLNVQRERNASIAAIAGIAILLELRSDRGRNGSGAEAGGGGRNDAGADP